MKYALIMLLFLVGCSCKYLGNHKQDIKNYYLSQPEMLTVPADVRDPLADCFASDLVIVANKFNCEYLNKDVNHSFEVCFATAVQVTGDPSYPLAILRHIAVTCADKVINGN